MSGSSPPAAPPSAPIIFGAQRDFLLDAHRAVSALAPTVLIRRPEQLDRALLERVRPAWVFLPDWSWIIAEELLSLAPFVGFHSADLPDYRGGSPLQHQILDGLTETRLCAFRMGRGVDTGPVLASERLSLQGSISEIWRRVALLVPPIVERIIAGDFEETPQGPGGFTRKRRRPADSEIPDLGLPLSTLHDWIRALDDPYPNAFVRIGGKRLSFKSAQLEPGRLTAQVTITDEAPEEG